MTIPCVIPVRNGLRYTRDCLRSLLAQDTETDIWVMDNASTDGTTEYLRAMNGVFTTRHYPALSVAAAWNFALAHLFGEGEQRVAVLNNDVKLRTDFIRSLAEADLPFATGVGVATMEQLNAPWTRTDREHPDFSAYMIRRDCWETVGPFSEEYAGAYCEDADFHVRAWRKGVHLTCIGIPFWHAASGTIKSATEKEAQTISAQAHDNRERFRKAYGCLPGSPEYEALFSEDTFGRQS